MARRDTFQQQVPILIEGAVKVLGYRHKLHGVQSIESLEKIAHDCRLILDNPKLWQDRVKKALEFYNEEMLSFYSEYIPTKLEDVCISNICVSGLERGDPNNYSYYLDLMDKEKNELLQYETLEASGSDPTIMQQDISDYLSNQETAK